MGVHGGHVTEWCPSKVHRNKIESVVEKFHSTMGDGSVKFT